MYICFGLRKCHMMHWWILMIGLFSLQQEIIYINAVVESNEINENSVVATNEAKLEHEGLKIESIEYKYNSPVFENSFEDDLMANAALPAFSVATVKPSDAENDEVDLMERTKRHSPSFDDIYDYISKPTVSMTKKSFVSNEHRSELTAQETSNIVDDNGGSSSGQDGMRGIMGELKASKHHKLTRNDIRQLAKKAVILATLKKLKEKNAGPTVKASSAEKKTFTPSKSNKKHKKSKKGKKKHHIEKHTHKTTVPATTASSIVAPSDKANEMAEDLSHASKKSTDPLTDDDPALKTDNDDGSMSKKSSISRIDDSVANMFDESDTTAKPTSTERSSISSSGSQLAEKVRSLRDFLSKSDASVIPVKFLPDLPSGLRMIGWKEMIEKKKKQLNELEATVGTVDDAAETKPVSLNIDVEDPLSSKTSASEIGDLSDLTAEKKSSDPVSLQHISYLQRHIKGARSLRKLIAKTLVGHCKSTGKRIFDAFVAMDKALARAQTIATVIGKKFNIDMDKIDGLVGDKEDQVIETFLKDIFTKI